ncbi:MAG TPA: PilZ domain-containing protein [Thermoplasmatales archaeon]|nr:PilZ domain-containing protein [Thermoplasmatales archaeon]
MRRERRKYARVNTVLYATFSDGTRKIREVIRNASAGGMMIETEEPWKIGTILDLIIDARSSIKGQGKVVWTAKYGEGYRMGIELKNLSLDAATVWADALMSFTDLWTKAGTDN